MPTPLLMQKLRLGGRNLCRFVNRGPRLSWLFPVLTGTSLHSSFLLCLPRIRKPPGMPTDRATQLQQDGIRLARRLPRLTQGFVLGHIKRTWAMLQSEEEPPCVADLGQFQALWSAFLLVPDLSQLATLFQVSMIGQGSSRVGRTTIGSWIAG